jgi:coenzyme F420-0:L-glutamate ligase/coenzyme F420-1:gamma-L-glutamate ligase
LRNFAAFALEGFPLVKPEDNVASMIVETCRKNGIKIEEGDVIVVAQKVFSKAEGRLSSLRDVVPSRRAKKMAETTGKSPRFVQLVLGEATRVLKASREVLLVEDKHGLVCINAGIDKSNVEGRGRFALLPKDPDESADKCRVKIRELTGKNVGVIISDTYSRPFRRAQVNFAIGFAGIRPFRDYRGKRDLFGNILKVKNVAVVDEIAGSAELLMGQGREARPVVIFRGLDDVAVDHEKHDVSELYMAKEEDLFRGTL